ncbi:hypothetical protein QJ48_09170 [Paenibacillus sp. A3]|uniref:NAD-dependent epimerase/dehydratase family protein n=1 Tax=Paenibacillus sp. A3 TaxID=1337054 RepID=UPI0006D58CBD|nr:NAD(P)-dependent oxidoreductase [Paenibacillus sp. A3]KPV59752.1 hypothetical protein QJ48_09170 [Paenibacillus sp. A3]
MKIIIVGHTSMVGKRLEEALIKKHEIITCGRDERSDIYIDLSETHLDSLRDNRLLENVDVIVHCAASFLGNTAEEAITNEIINSVGSLKIGLLAQKVKCKQVIYISSISAYDNVDNEYFGSYGLSKKHGQENLKLICNELGIRYTALLPSQIYDEKGLAQKHQKLFYHFINCAYHGNDINIFGENDAVRNYLYIGDLIEIVVKVVEDKIVGEYPCIYPQSYKLSEIAKFAFEVFGSGGLLKFLKDKPSIPDIFIPNDIELYKQIHYTPQTDMRTGMTLIKKNLQIGGV